ncbi:MAG TPA: hypothetical protein VGF60_18060 [Xanthobacteraceae bacterium]|jgi:hypothetical protein
MTPHLNTPHLMRSLAAAIALLGLLAAPALAQRISSQSPEAAAPDLARPNVVMFHGKKIGQDPDPFIRNEMLRHADSGWAD